MVYCKKHNIDYYAFCYKCVLEEEKKKNRTTDDIINDYNRCFDIVRNNLPDEFIGTLYDLLELEGDIVKLGDKVYKEFTGCVNCGFFSIMSMDSICPNCNNVKGKV